MREIIHLQLGQAGNQIGTKFWERLCQEHGVDLSGKYEGKQNSRFDKKMVYYDHMSSGYYIPRAVLVDLDPGPIDHIKSGGSGKLFKTSNCVSAHSSAGSNWSKGMYTEGAEIADSTLEVIRREVERCDEFQGFQFVHSLGGGTGSGMGSLLLSKLREEFVDSIFCTYSIWPSNKVSDSVVEPYNAILTLHQLTENADIVVLLDNEAIYDLTKIARPSPNYSDLNRLVTQAMSGVTCPFRFPDQINSNQRRLALNLAPFPRLHFLMVHLAPLDALQAFDVRSPSVPELVQEMFSTKNVLCAADPSEGKCLSAGATFRGKISRKQAEEQINLVQSKHSSSFVEWIPDNVKASVCPVALTDSPLSAVLVANSTCIQRPLKRVLSRFNAMFNRKAFLWNFVGEGMDEMELVEAKSNTDDLLAEYEQYQGIDN